MLVLSACKPEVVIEKITMPPLNLGEASKPVLPDTEVTKKLEASKTNPLKSNELKPFGSREEFNAYFDELKTRSTNENPVNDILSPPVSAAPPSSDAAETGEARGGITNNQESGVDEGGIVKTVGDYLVILRRGRLFSIKVEQGSQSLELGDTTDAFPPDHSHDTWYDELLVHKNKIIVVGYSYGFQATELGLFSIDEEGHLRHEATHFLRSNDYYSSRNYASRLVDGKLVFYMPFYFYTNDELILPARSRLLENGTQNQWQDIIDVSTIIQPIEETLYPVLHTIVQCDLEEPIFACEATSVVGPFARTFYVSPTAVYLWNSGEEAAAVYRLPLDGSAPTAVLAEGSPTDQFSFKETDDGSLQVLLREGGGGDVMWAPEFTEGNVALLSLSAQQFSREPIKVAESAYTLLPKVEGFNFHNRFVGPYALYGSNARQAEGDAHKILNIVNLKNRQTASLNLEHDVERLEALGSNALVVGSKGQDLVFSTIALDDLPEIKDSFVLPNSGQGEHRSHGFFYKPHAESSGIIGLPVRNESGTFNELTETSASIIYLAVNQNRLSKLGSLESTATTNFDDNCKASCVDWYGNSRPIFWRDRIFGLLGYDLVEGVVNEDRLTEKVRVNFMPRTSDRP
jgi:hypothetical protein